MRSFTQEWSRRTGIKLDLEVEEDFGRLPEALELPIFRIVQERLNDIWKHADASEAAATLRPTSPRLLLISISDNGRGIDQQFNLAWLGSDGHYGLLVLLGGGCGLKIGRWAGCCCKCRFLILGLYESRKNGRFRFRENR